MRWAASLVTLAFSLTWFACSEGAAPSEDGGDACTEGSCPCDADGQCPDGFVCKEYDTDCTVLDTAECVAVDQPDCDFSGELACTCAGNAVPSHCLPFGNGYATSAETCASGTFACGTSTCLRGLEACVETSGAQGSSFACWSAAEHGCSTYGVPDCACLDVPSAPDGSCTLSTDGIVMILLATTPG